jgi:hypothetical protein
MHPFIAQVTTPSAPALHNAPHLIDQHHSQEMSA